MQVLMITAIISLAAATYLPQGFNSSVALDACLTAGLSKDASIAHSPSAAPRWSEFGEPMPGTVVQVATEKDVQVAVRV